MAVGAGSGGLCAAPTTTGAHRARSSTVQTADALIPPAGPINYSYHVFGEEETASNKPALVIVQGLAHSQYLMSLPVVPASSRMFRRRLWPQSRRHRRSAPLRPA